MIFSKLSNGRFPGFKTIVEECVKANSSDEPSSGANEQPKSDSKCIII